MRKASLKAEQKDLRDRMLDAGLTSAEIAGEFIRRYRFRPRAAFRHAHGWTLLRAAEHINDHAAILDIDTDGRATMTGPHLCELEHWPHPAERRRLTPQVLALLAATYGTDVHSLIDVHDRACLRPADRLVIDSMGASSVATCICGLHGERQAAISAARTVPLRELSGVRSSAPVQPLPVV
jgi:hypothetical protein